MVWNNVFNSYLIRTWCFFIELEIAFKIEEDCVNNDNVILHVAYSKFNIGFRPHTRFGLIGWHI